MVIRVEYDKDKGWCVDENAAMVFPEFREVLLDKSLGITAMAYIALGCDTASDNPIGECFDTTEERLAEAEKDVFGVNGRVTDNPIIHRAIKKYERILDTPWGQMRKEIKGGIKSVSEYLKKTGGSLNDDNVATFLTALEKMPKVLTALDGMKSNESEQVEKVKKRVKADKALGARSRQYQNK